MPFYERSSVTATEMQEMMQYFREHRNTVYGHIHVTDLPPSLEPKKSKFSAFIRRVEEADKAKAARSLKTALAEKGRFAYNKKPQDRVKKLWQV